MKQLPRQLHKETGRAISSIDANRHLHVLPDKIRPRQPWALRHSRHKRQHAAQAQIPAEAREDRHRRAIPISRRSHTCHNQGNHA